MATHVELALDGRGHLSFKCPEAFSAWKGATVQSEMWRFAVRVLSLSDAHFDKVKHMLQTNTAWLAKAGIKHTNTYT
jgi:hypothetical protein